ncbi:UNVERIFIED_CONTAM: hypothetical protein GTU68_044886, partial [Idotea baltica]|nr:hypothetical protein [Idotea baltica]
GGDRHRIEYSGGGHRGGERHHSRIESSGSGHEDGDRHRIEYSGGGYQGGERHRVESSGGGHQVRERHRIESSSGSGHHDGERYHSRIESSGREGVRHGSDGGETRYRFDWNLPDDRQYNRHYEGDRVRSESGGDRWSTSGGFRRRYYDSDGNPREGDTRYDDRAFEDGSSYHTSRHSRRYESSRDLQQPQNDESSIHGDTYSRAVVDRNSGNVQVYSQKVFSRRSGDHWQEVHGPFKDEEWSQDFHYDDEPLKRTKREREFVIKPEAITDAQTGKTMQIVNFRCDGDVPTAKCFTFQCTIRNLDADQSATIRIPSRLWNSTLVEDYPRVSFVSIKSKGELILPEAIRVDQDQSDDVSYAETLAYSNLLEQLPAEEVPLWVILVSILAGLLLLVLIAIILWKLGFFKRKRPDPTLSGNIDRDANGYN